MSAMSKSDVIKICDALGADAMCKALGVSKHAVRYARTDGIFPGSWYGTLKPLCDRSDVICPLEAFNWRSADPAEAAAGGAAS